VRLRDDHFQVLVKNSLKAELYFKLGWDKLSLAQHKELAKTLANELPGCAIHLPYNSKGPARNIFLPEEVDKLEKYLDLIDLYEPEHLIGHAQFQALNDSASGPRKFMGQKNGPLDDYFHEPSQEFLDSSLSWWTRVLNSSKAPLYLENTFEHSPLPICRLIDLLGPRTGLCLDIGHWFFYAMGKHWDNFPEWLLLSGPRLAHLHLHDNNGEADQHLGLGQGKINFPALWPHIKSLSPGPTCTLENHRADGLLQSLAYLEQNPLF
jgi:sugar phosphate isomerase/epimerase